MIWSKKSGAVCTSPHQVPLITTSASRKAAVSMPSHASLSHPPGVNGGTDRMRTSASRRAAAAAMACTTTGSTVCSIISSTRSPGSSRTYSHRFRTPGISSTIAYGDTAGSAT